MLRYLNISLGLLILISQNLCAWQVTRGTTLFLADGKIAHLVPESVVRKTMDVTLATADDVEMTDASAGHDRPRYVVQVGTFAVKENAFRLEQKLRNEEYVVRVWQYVSRAKRLYYVVTVGEYATVAEAQQKLGSINVAHNVEGLVLVQGYPKN
ncbi:MAG TPA: SPOR domain-containing protein [Saprospiraceae bacterium]|nr:SPOR domain-containing protein [Saprospiraceae bacterium]